MTVIESGTMLFGRYKVMRVLGRGGSGTVYLAENVRVGNLVAIKVVSKENKDVSLMAEKDILRELRHPSIPIIMDIEEDEGDLFLIEEYVEGTSLNGLNKTLSEVEVLAIMNQLVDVLLYLHTSMNEPIIYRDLKPDNIIRMQNGHIKLVDFGIAKRFCRHQSSDTVQFGTRGYAAPEQYGMARADVRTDIFSLGVCIYYLLTGKNLSTPPYKLNPLRQENDSVSAGLSKIITKCVQTVPAKRYQNIVLLRDDLLRLGQEDNPHRDYEVFAKSSKKRILVNGIKSGIGTTHMALMVAGYYRVKGKKVAVVEYHRSEVFQKICMMNEDVLEKRHSFVMEGVEYYPFYYYGGYEQLMTKDYDVIVIDGGMLGGAQKPNVKTGIDTLLMCGCKAWEMDLFEDYYFDRPDLNCHYLFNFAEVSDYERVVDGLKGLKCYRVPFNPDPHDVSEEADGIFARMFGEAVTQGQPEKGRWDDIKEGFREIFRKFEGA